MLDTAAMTQHLASFLAPLLPYLTGTKDKAGREFSADVWERATAMWSRLRPKIEARESAMEAAHDASQSPEDADALAAFRLQLKKLLAEDAALAKDLAGLIEPLQSTSGQVERSGDRNVSVGGSSSHSWIITGNWNVVNSRANDK